MASNKLRASTFFKKLSMYVFVLQVDSLFLSWNYESEKKVNYC